MHKYTFNVHFYKCILISKRRKLKSKKRAYKRPKTSPFTKSFSLDDVLSKHIHMYVMVCIHSLLFVLVLDKGM